MSKHYMPVLGKRMEEPAMKSPEELAREIMDDAPVGHRGCGCLDCFLRVVVLIRSDRAASEERIKALEQVASGNEERLALLAKKHTPGQTLTEHETLRLAALHEAVCLAFPRAKLDKAANILSRELRLANAPTFLAMSDALAALRSDEPSAAVAGQCMKCGNCPTGCDWCNESSAPKESQVGEAGNRPVGAAASTKAAEGTAPASPSTPCEHCESGLIVEVYDGDIGEKVPCPDCGTGRATSRETQDPPVGEGPTSNGPAVDASAVQRASGGGSQSDRAWVSRPAEVLSEEEVARYRAEMLNRQASTPPDRYAFEERLCDTVEILRAQLGDVRMALDLILPLASAYAHQKEIESSLRYVAIAEDALQRTVAQGGGDV